jgi:hypothetical protein
VAGALALWLAASAAPLAAEPALAAAPGTPGGKAETGQAAKAGLAVDQVVFCAAIKDRFPAGVADTFPADIYGVYCYSRVTGASDTTAVRHLWYRGETKMAERRLPVRSSPWRTWSAKEMRKDWSGDWRVDVVGPDGTVLASKRFCLK